MTSARTFEKLLGMEPPWRVLEVVLRMDEPHPGRGGPVVGGTVEIHVAHQGATRCPECGSPCPGYDSRHRRWRHLDTMQHQTRVHAEVPRVRCAEHGIRQLRVPWADSGSRFTALFEAEAIEWLRAASVHAVARRMGLSWDQAAGIQRRAVERGLARRQFQRPRLVGVDETSFRRRHKYVTVVNDLERGVVVHVADGRDRSAIDSYFQDLGETTRAGIEQVAMDMWPAYISSVEEYTAADIVHDRFHIVAHLNHAVDLVRRAEQRELLEAGDPRLKRSRYLWLMKSGRMTRPQQRRFAALRASHLRVARAWAIKEMARDSWGYVRRGWAERRWKRWYDWAVRSRLEPIKKVAKMIRNHWDAVINAALSSISSANAEGINAKIQEIKRKAHGYRNRAHFRLAIYFHLGGLELAPDSLYAHTQP